MAVNKYLMGQMTWPELREVVGEGRIAVMPAGIIEQHGPQLPLDTDIFLAEQVTVRAAALHPEKVVVVPPIVHGHSPHHMDFPGTLTVDPQHMINYVLDVCLSLSHHGFRKDCSRERAWQQCTGARPGGPPDDHPNQGRDGLASIFYFNSVEFDRTAAELFPEMAGRYGHADDVETSMYLGVRPELVQLDKARDEPPTDLMELGSGKLPLRLIWSSFLKEGIYGTVSGASPAKGERLLAAAVEGLAKIFVQFYEKNIPKPVDHHK